MNGSFPKKSISFPEKKTFFYESSPVSIENFIPYFNSYISSKRSAYLWQRLLLAISGLWSFLLLESIFINYGEKSESESLSESLPSASIYRQKTSSTYSCSSSKVQLVLIITNLGGRPSM